MLKIVLPKVVNHVFYTMSDVFINRLNLRDSWHIWKFESKDNFCELEEIEDEEDDQEKENIISKNENEINDEKNKEKEKENNEKIEKK